MQMISIVEEFIEISWSKY